MLSDYALNRIACEKGIKIEKEELEEEVRILNMEAAHRRQYAALMNNADPMESESPEQVQEEIFMQAMQNLRIRHLIDETIREQEFPVTKAELQEEAEAMAARQNVSIDMIRGFFGDDLAMLKSDVLEKKALKWLEETTK